MLLLSLLGMQLAVVAQKKTSDYRDSLFARYADTSTAVRWEDRRYFITSLGNEQFPPTATVIRRLSSNLAIVSINNPAHFDALRQQAKIAPATNEWKWSPAAKKLVHENRVGNQAIILTATDLSSLISILKNQFPDATIISTNEPSRSVVVKCKGRDVDKNFLSLNEVIFVDVAQAPRIETAIIGYDRSFHGINAVDFLLPGANGRNIVAGVKEQKIEENDLDVYKRVLPSSIAGGATTNHATVIASIIGGAGNSFYDGRGIASGCLFFPSSFSNLFADDAGILVANKVTVQNHSYGTIVQQFYGAEAVSYDALAWQNKNYIPVFSAGNRGEAAATEGKYANIPGYANLTGNFKMAKNVINVGAVDNKGNIAAESSSGPLYDGRMAPQIIALGPNGTSDAAAIVTGTIAVMQQVYADSNSGTLPNASLVKALLYNTASDIGPTGIDYKTGFGELDSYEAITALQQNKYVAATISAGQLFTKNIVVPPNTAQLKVTLSWTDSAATVNNNVALLNDLDLEVTEVSRGQVYQPWVLSTAASADSLSAPARRQRDSINTSEQVSVVSPRPGSYSLRVKGSTVLNDAVSFALAFKTDTLGTFRFTSPLHAADVNRAENPLLEIRWKTVLADTSQAGNLYISYNNGLNWEMLAASHKLISNRFQWSIKDTNTTALLKMETGFGVFFSRAFIISKLTRPTVDFVCADSFRLSWNPHVYASGYNIFALTDSPYLKQVRTTTDTFAIFDRSVYTSKVYAVQPVLTNGLAAARSVALDIEQQGVQCFYRTLNYTLLDLNQLKLLLELSVTTYADSVFFEKVTATGQLLQTYGAAVVSNNNFVYTLLTGQPGSGITYLRGRILLKNGAIVYTDVIPVLTSGPKAILFYPNPANRNEYLRYKLQQGVPTGSSLHFYDVTGRLLKSYDSIPDNITLSSFPAGLLVYKLLSMDKQVLQTGKIIIH
jgi:hypothetical protein